MTVASRIFWASAAIVHLGLLAFGASQMRLPDASFPARSFHAFLDGYGILSGANLGYTYFAPEIGSELRARFEIQTARGTRINDSLQGGMSREAVLRVNNIIGLFGEAARDESARRKLAASWAGKMFARHSDATRVTVALESFELPSHADYSRGERPKWRGFYRATFGRRAQEVSHRAE